MKTLALAIITALATLTASAATNTVALITSNTAPIIEPFNPTPTRLMQPADRVAYVKAGGSAKASDVDIYRWWHRIVSNGVIYVQTANAISTVANPANADYWAGKVAAWHYVKNGDFRQARYAAQATVKTNSLSEVVVEGINIDVQNIIAATGMTSAPPSTMTVTNPVYTRFP